MSRGVRVCHRRDAGRQPSGRAARSGRRSSIAVPQQRRCHRDERHRDRWLTPVCDRSRPARTFTSSRMAVRSRSRFSETSLPLALALLLDTSASMEQNSRSRKKPRSDSSASWPGGCGVGHRFRYPRPGASGFHERSSGAREAIRQTDGRRVDRPLQRRLHRPERAEQDRALMSRCSRVASTRHRDSVRRRRYVEPRRL